MVAAPAGEVRGWSADELRAARPATPPTARPGGPRAGASQARARGSAAREVAGEGEAPLLAHGRVFFRAPGTDSGFSCSGTVVRSRTANLVYTAGHCVYDTDSGKPNHNVVFVPAYRDGQAPHGQYPAEVLYAPAGWVTHNDTSFDLGVISLREPVQQAIGTARPIAFKQPLNRIKRFTTYGYPALPSPPYDGERPIACDVTFDRALNTGTPRSLIASPCEMRQGSSGGGWIAPSGHLFSVISSGYCEDGSESCGQIVGPYFGNAAIELYKRAGGSEPIDLRVLRGPPRVTPARRPAFRHVADASTPVTYECRVDRVPFSRCRTIWRAPRLRPGRHVFRVRATDQTGRRALARHVFLVRPKARPLPLPTQG